MTELTNETYLKVLLLACLFVLLQWGFWERGVFAFGVNTVLIGAAFLGFLIWSRGARINRHDVLWLTPLGLALVSIFLYENPWLKSVSLVVLPIATGFICAFRQTSECDNRNWSVALFGRLLAITLAPLESMPRVGSSMFRAAGHSVDDSSRNLFKRIAIGLVFLTFAAFIVIPLLASADDKFLALVLEAVNWAFQAINFSVPLKAICIILCAILFASMRYVWLKEYEYEPTFSRVVRLDDVIVCVVILGTLLIYLAFIFVQFDTLFLSDLPTDFKTTERLVKSGFWQLFFLSFLNSLAFFVIYKNTAKLGQVLLGMFILASSLVLLSGCWRMGLYIYWYGLSHEKFFAGYTALFSIFVFAYLIYASFGQNRKDLLKVLVLSSLWGYALISVMPVEKIIFRSNIALAEVDGSRVDLRELITLSVDVIEDVEKAKSDGLLSEGAWEVVSNKGFGNADVETKGRWATWSSKISNRECKGKWYETNLSRIMYCR